MRTPARSACICDAGATTAIRPCRAQGFQEAHGRCPAVARRRGADADRLGRRDEPSITPAARPIRRGLGAADGHAGRLRLRRADDQLPHPGHGLRRAAGRRVAAGNPAGPADGAGGDRLGAGGASAVLRRWRPAGLRRQPVQPGRAYLLGGLPAGLPPAGRRRTQPLAPSHGRCRGRPATGRAGPSAEVGAAARAPYRLSSGEQRAVAIADVLAMAPAIRVPDEPSAGSTPLAAGSCSSCCVACRRRG